MNSYFVSFAISCLLFRFAQMTTMDSDRVATASCNDVRYATTDMWNVITQRCCSQLGTRCYFYNGMYGAQYVCVLAIPAREYEVTYGYEHRPQDEEMSQCCTSRGANTSSLSTAKMSKLEKCKKLEAPF